MAPEMEKDFLDEIVAERTAANREFPAVLAAAERTRALMRQLAEERERVGLTQSEVANRMGTSQPAVARMEACDVDPRLSTVERYAEVIGFRLRMIPT